MPYMIGTINMLAHERFFMYSCRAFSNSSLIFRAEPVVFTTNLIHACQVSLSMLIEVLAFSLEWLNTKSLLHRVVKVGGNYHKLLISKYMVMWYNGNVLCDSAEGRIVS